MGDVDKSAPAGDGEYEVQQGECIGSIAFENGFLPDTLWNHPANQALANSRKDSKVLLPGDRLHIPPLRIRQEDCATDQLHQFVRHGLPEKLRIVLLDEHKQPRAGLPFDLLIDGTLVCSGTTSPKGLIEAPIPPNARSGELIIDKGKAGEYYDLGLGCLDPPSTVTGVQARLNNLGFFCGAVDGIVGHHTRTAVAAFQASAGLDSTGVLDDDTRKELVRQHGF